MGPLRLDPLDDARRIVRDCVVLELCRTKTPVRAADGARQTPECDVSGASIWGAVALLGTSIMCSALVVVWCITGQ
jgi:hypothetical protein